VRLPGRGACGAQASHFRTCSGSAASASWSATSSACARTSPSSATTRCCRRGARAARPGAAAARSREPVKAFAAARCCSRGALRARPGGPGAAGANAGRGVQSRLPRSPPREQLHRSLGFQRALRSCASARQTPPGNGAHALLRPALARAHSLATCVLSARAACCGRVVCHAALGPHRRASCLCWA